MKTASADLREVNLRTSLILILLVVLSCLAAGDAVAENPKHFPGMHSFDNAPSQDLPAGQVGSHERRIHIDGTGKMKHEKVDPDRDKLTTIPHWTGEFSYHDIIYPYTMVGTDPKKGSATTVVPTVIIPLRFVFADGVVTDTSTDLVDGQTAIQGIVNSPVFRPYNFVTGGTKVGNTQYGDAFQRANFWKEVSTKAPDYHVLLGQPTVLPVQTIIVPADKGGLDPSFSIPLRFVDPDFLQQHVQALISQFDIPLQALPIFVTGRTAIESATSFSLAYHGAVTASSAKRPLQGAFTYIVTCYFSQQDPDLGSSPDVYPFSHEVNEWLDDPFGNNFTPGWNLPFYPADQCISFTLFQADLLEVCDPLEFFLESTVALTGSSSFTYHVADTVFLDFFTRSDQSTAVNGQFSFFGVAPAPSSPCTGHLEVEQTLFAFPGALRTEGLGINQGGKVVGFYVDVSRRHHGFLLDGNAFSTIDFPGATDTVAYKINDSGLVVGYFYKADGVPHGFSSKNGVYTPIDFPGAIDTVASGVNLKGDIVGAYDDANFVTHGFEVHNGQYLRTDAPYASQTQLTSINDEGRVVGFTWDDSFNGPYVGLVKDGANFTMINFPGAQFTEPFSINNSSVLTGQFFDADGISDGFVTLFGFPYAIYGSVLGNNDRGQIVGATFNRDGRQVGFTAQLPTKPVGP